MHRIVSGTAIAAALFGLGACSATISENGVSVDGPNLDLKTSQERFQIALKANGYTDSTMLGDGGPVVTNDSKWLYASFTLPTCTQRLFVLKRQVKSSTDTSTVPFTFEPVLKNGTWDARARKFTGTPITLPATGKPGNSPSYLTVGQYVLDNRKVFGCGSFTLRIG